MFVSFFFLAAMVLFGTSSPVYIEISLFARSVFAWRRDVREPQKLKTSRLSMTFPMLVESRSTKGSLHSYTIGIELFWSMKASRAEDDLSPHLKDDRCN